MTATKSDMPIINIGSVRQSMLFTPPNAIAYNVAISLMLVPENPMISRVVSSTRPW